MENEDASERLEDLKRRCRLSPSSLGVLVNYSTPEEGAEYMFNCIWKHITTHLLTDRDAEHELSEKESLSVPHESFLLSWSSVYIGGEDYFCRLNQYVVDTKGTPMVVPRDPGCGKSAMLST